MELVRCVYELSRSFPVEEKFGLTNQVRRASVSLPSNIAEGYGRHSTQDYVRFLQIASGSLYELQTQIEIASMLGYISDSEFDSSESLANECAKMLSALINRLRDKTT